MSLILKAEAQNAPFGVCIPATCSPRHVFHLVVSVNGSIKDEICIGPEGFHPRVPYMPTSLSYETKVKKETADPFPKRTRAFNHTMFDKAVPHQVPPLKGAV